MSQWKKIRITLGEYFVENVFVIKTVSHNDPLLQHFLCTVEWRERGGDIYCKTLLVYKNEHVHKESIKRRKWAQDTGQLVVMWAQATELKLVSVLEQPRYISPDSTAINERYLYSISIQTKQRSEDREPVKLKLQHLRQQNFAA